MPPLISGEKHLILASQIDAIDALASALLQAESLEGDIAGRIIDTHLSIERPESA
jgi:hypothetical protein